MQPLKSLLGGIGTIAYQRFYVDLVEICIPQATVGSCHLAHLSRVYTPLLPSRIYSLLPLSIGKRAGLSTL